MKRKIVIKRVSLGYIIDNLPNYDVGVVARNIFNVIDYLRMCMTDQKIAKHLDNIKRLSIGDVYQIEVT